MKNLLLISVLFLMACGSSSGNNQATGQTSLYGYGDSISAGGGWGDSYLDIISLAKGWFEINKSIGGTEMTDKNQMPLIMYDCCSANRWQDNDVVFYSPGVNDSSINGLDQTYMTSYLNSLITFLTTQKNYSVKIYIGTPTHNCNEANSSPNSTIDAYAALNRQAVKTANAPNVTLIDYNANFIPTAGNTIDCLHPNVTGYTQMAAYFLSQVGVQ
jgi:hypothetical protein